MKRQADGRFKTKVVIGTRADGTKVTKWITAKSKKDLEAKRQAVLIKYRDGVSEQLSDVMATDFIMQYYEVQMKPYQKPGVAKGVLAHINKYVLPPLQDKRMKAVTAFDLQEIMNSVEGMSKTLVSVVKQVLQGAFSSAYSQGVIPRDVSSALYSRAKAPEKRRALTDEETAIIKKALSERTTEPLLLGLLYYTGMRRGEICGLKWSDIDMKEGVMHIVRDLDLKTGKDDTLKTAAARRDIPVPAPLKAILTEYRGIGNTYVLQNRDGGAWCLRTYTRHYDKIAKLVPGVTAHYFRHNYATLLYDEGIDVLTASRILGHSDPRTTMTIYTDLERSRKIASQTDAVKGAFE
ncbi:MAG: site-specific integrase [Clostridia bacterium]|nr:site-specific integrase [Clostridia bacterium]